MRYLLRTTLLCVAACHRPGPAEAPPARPMAVLTSHAWILDQLDGRPAPLGADSRPATLTFTDAGRASGFAGCNRMAGSFTLHGSALRFGPLVMTRMACMKGMELETRFAAALDEVRTYGFRGDTLELRSRSAVIARLR